MEYLLSDQEFDITNQEQILSLLFGIESRILGELPAITRLYAHFLTIFQMIGNRLGWRTSERVRMELDQLYTIFNYDQTDVEVLREIIKKKDYKQYNNKYKKPIQIIKFKIEILNTELFKYVKMLKHDYRKANEKLFKTKKEIQSRNELFIEFFRKMNNLINYIRSYKHDIPFIIKPHVTKSRAKHKQFLCASSVFGLSPEEYADLIEDDIKFSIHGPTRKYECIVSKSSFEMFINKCLEDPIARVLSDTCVELFVKCPCTKINNVVCNEEFNLNELLQKHKMFDQYKSQIIQITSRLIEKKYKIKYFVNCRTPDCQNGNGYIQHKLLQDILDDTLSSKISPQYICDLCDKVWCTICDKSHPGRICAMNDDELLLDGTNKRCPECKAPCHRTDGCFHMKCPNCYVHWCWDCNQLISQSQAYSHHVCPKPEDTP